MRRRLGDDERGFTLIELMVVVLVIAILIAVAVPTFLGAREKANARAAQSKLRNAVAAGRAHLADGNGTTGLLSALPTLEPGLQFNVTEAQMLADGKVWVRATPAPYNTIWYGIVDADGRCWYVQDTGATGGKVEYGRAEKGCAGAYSVDEPVFGASFSSAPLTDY